ncbi:MAG: hypothetical protein DMF49_07090 [Acidobacteria bacterium]|nr:MAG: hypothetical protein DMF49_07090 [Acidobacteriota bacterium]
MRSKQTGFTLIELLIVVAIIGIIAAIAIPNLLNAIDRGKQKRTMADIRSVGTAVEEYAVRLGCDGHRLHGSFLRQGCVEERQRRADQQLQLRHRLPGRGVHRLAARHPDIAFPR